MESTAELSYFSTHSCRLGESPIWNRWRNSFLWLDILNKTLFEKRIESRKKDYDRKWCFRYIPSLILSDLSKSNIIWIVADDAVHRFNLDSSYDQVIGELSLPESHRTNDGAVGPDGTIYFGTMQRQPDGRHGQLYSFSPQGVLKENLIEIGIPNTFVWVDSHHVAISDSFTQSIDLYRTREQSLEYVQNLYNFEAYGGEPDGGTLDSSGMIWLALWGKGEIVCLDPLDKKIISKIELPVIFSSSCCFGGDSLNKLLVTSATMEKENCLHNEYVDGRCLLLDMAVSGKELECFSFDKDREKK